MMQPHRILNGRRGNALVLVSAMLVLLTLIAAAYLTRTRSQRVTASAMQETAGGTRRSDIVGKQLAEDRSHGGRQLCRR
jgi:archaellin